MAQKQKKSSVGSRVLSALLKTQATRRHEAYQRHVRDTKKTGGKPLSFRRWAGDSIPKKVSESIPKPSTKKPKETATSLLVEYARRRGKPKQSQ